MEKISHKFFLLKSYLSIIIILQIFTDCDILNLHQILGNNMKRIYIGNMNFSTTEESIKNLFSKYGEVNLVEIIKDKYTEQSKGFGFVEMEDDVAQKAISALNGTDFEGRRIRVNFAQEMPQRNNARNFLKNKR